jgi:hypothetical protein
VVLQFPFFVGKREEDIELKEQCRGAVRLELENMERTCRDVSSILRALGIPVEGGEVCCIYLLIHATCLKLPLGKDYLLIF